MLGKRISHYRIIEKLGEGGMGVVYKAKDTRLNRIVAVKLLPAEKLANTQARERLQREARAVSQLNHPNICTLHDIGHENGADFLVMEYVEGKTLKGPLPLNRALELAVQISRALDHAHRWGIVHRDLKPANILVTKSGIKLLDFGLAKAVEPPTGAEDETKTAVAGPLTSKGTILGTYRYMSPGAVGRKESRPPIRHLLLRRGAL